MSKGPAELAAIVLRRTIELAVIPAPPGEEQRRAGQGGAVSELEAL